jgi:hypothetical protein
MLRDSGQLAAGWGGLCRLCSGTDVTDPVDIADATGASEVVKWLGGENLDTVLCANDG